jgi:two-component system chemotaxis response regulator CheY
LLAEDDFTSRVALQGFLSRYGECHVVVNGREAVEAARQAIEGGRRYDLICLDIVMPEMTGREALRQVRMLEEAKGISSSKGAKIVMTTSISEVREVFRCYSDLCDSYLLKPIDHSQLLALMKTLQLVT